VIGLSNNDVISLRSLRCVRCVGWKPRFSPRVGHPQKIFQVGQSPLSFHAHRPSLFVDSFCSIIFLYGTFITRCLNFRRHRPILPQCGLSVCSSVTLNGMRCSSAGTLAWFPAINCLNRGASPVRSGHLGVVSTTLLTTQSRNTGSTYTPGARPCDIAYIMPST